jgi:hypothetical protein
MATYSMLDREQSSEPATSSNPVVATSAVSRD